MIQESARGEVRGLRAHAAVRVGQAPALGHGKGPWWTDATRARYPGKRPVVLAYRNRPHKTHGKLLDKLTWIDGHDLDVDHAMDLDAIDVVVVRTGSWTEDDPSAEVRSAAIAGFVKRGGALFGPDPGAAWPARLAAQLGDASTTNALGADGERRLGLGRVVRIANDDALFDALLSEPLWPKPLATVFDRRGVVPPSPFGPWADDPAPRRLLAGALGLFALWVAFVVGVQRLGLRSLALLAAGSIAAVFAIDYLTLPTRGHSIDLHPIELVVGDERRLQAVRLEAGPAGFTGRLQFQAPGYVRLLGGQVSADGKIRLAARHGAWLVLEREPSSFTIGLFGPTPDALVGDPPRAEAFFIGDEVPQNVEVERSDRSTSLALLRDGQPWHTEMWRVRVDPQPARPAATGPIDALGDRSGCIRPLKIGAVRALTPVGAGLRCAASLENLASESPMRQKTTVITQSHHGAEWFVVDASKETLGRMAVEIARRLMGKHKPHYTPHVDVGDYIIVTNAAQVQVTGGKEMKKVYRSHTGHPGGLREISYARMQERHPEEIIRLAVRRMLPKNNLGRAMLRKLKVYREAHHQHDAQKPTVLEFGTGR